MRLHHLFRRVAPLAAMGLATALSGCADVKYSVNGSEGEELADLDMSGDPPSAIQLLGPDRVNVTTGERLAIDVDGSDRAIERMRFALTDGSLAIMRANGEYSDSETATVNVTMPAPREMTLAGSGTITLAAMAREAEVQILGSGRGNVASMDADRLSVTMAGSGRFTTLGRARELRLSVMGSGTSSMRELEVNRARVSVMGSGDTIFASDGTVEANVMGSGDVTIRGRARCRVNSMGSGEVVCEMRDDDAGAAAPAE